MCSWADHVSFPSHILPILLSVFTVLLWKHSLHYLLMTMNLLSLSSLFLATHSCYIVWKTQNMTAAVIGSQRESQGESQGERQWERQRESQGERQGESILCCMLETDNLPMWSELLSPYPPVCLSNHTVCTEYINRHTHVCAYTQENESVCCLLERDVLEGFSGWGTTNWWVSLWVLLFVTHPWAYQHYR